jgi:hypothetical protein
VVSLDPVNQLLWFTHPAYLFLGEIDIVQGRCEQAFNHYQSAYQTGVTERQKAQGLERCNSLAEEAACQQIPKNACLEMLEQ